MRLPQGADHSLRPHNAKETAKKQSPFYVLQRFDKPHHVLQDFSGIGGGNCTVSVHIQKGQPLSGQSLQLHKVSKQACGILSRHDSIPVRISENWQR